MVNIMQLVVFTIVLGMCAKLWSGSGQQQAVSKEDMVVGAGVDEEKGKVEN